VIQCCVCLSSVVVVVCTECLAKWCLLEQKLLLTASYIRNRLVPKWMALTFVYRSYEGHDEGLSKTIKVGPAIASRRPCFNCAWQLTSSSLSLPSRASPSFSISPLISLSWQQISQKYACHNSLFYFSLILYFFKIRLAHFVTTSMQIFSDIHTALHSLRMGPAKGAKISTNNSTLEVWVTLQQGHRQWNLAWDIQKQKAFSFRGPDPRPAWTPLGAQPQAPKRSPSSKFATTPLTLGLYSIFRPAFGSLW